MLKRRVRLKITFITREYVTLQNLGAEVVGAPLGGRPSMDCDSFVTHHESTKQKFIQVEGAPTEGRPDKILQE